MRDVPFGLTPVRSRRARIRSAPRPAGISDEDWAIEKQKAEQLMAAFDAQAERVKQNIREFNVGQDTRNPIEILREYEAKMREGTDGAVVTRKSRLYR